VAPLGDRYRELAVERNGRGRLYDDPFEAEDVAGANDAGADRLDQPVSNLGDRLLGARRVGRSCGIDLVAFAQSLGSPRIRRVFARADWEPYLPIYERRARWHEHGDRNGIRCCACGHCSRAALVCDTDAEVWASWVTAYVALLRAVNVGGTGKLPMPELKTMAEALGFTNVRTWIASGNLLFSSGQTEAEVKAALEARLADYAGKPVPVLVRTGKEMAAILAADPFPDAHGSRALTYFFDAPLPADTIETVRGRQAERIALGAREIYVDYGDGIRYTKLKFSAMTSGTGRNMNTVRKLVALAHGAPR
jgi:uncharacterized protein (DUF1697 family)